MGYTLEDRLSFLFGAWAALAVEPYRNHSQLGRIEQRIGALITTASEARTSSVKVSKQ